jgi:hypothetical protein
MEKPVWILKDQADNPVWTTFQPDYITVIESALQHLGYRLVWGDLEKCPDCGFWNALCICRKEK